MATEPRWNLSSLYGGINDPRIERDMDRITKKARAFAKAHRQDIIKTISAPALQPILQDYSSILSQAHKLEAYAYLEHSTHVSSHPHGALLQLISTWASEAQNMVTFFPLAISKLPGRTLSSLIRDKNLAKYRHFLERQRDRKPHYVSEEQEHIIQEKSLTGNQALVRLYDQEQTAIRYTLAVGKKKKTVTESETLNLFHHPKQEYRRAAAIARHEPYKEGSRINTLAYNMLMQDYGIEAKRRNFETPASWRYLDDEIDKATIDAMESVVVGSYPVVHDYYLFKKKLLGLQKQYEYDRYAPLHVKEKIFSFPEAREIVLDAFHDFSPAFAKTAKKFFDNGWIDVPPGKDKRGGAYCMYVTPKTHPYILLNFTGSMNDVSTLAHELGHGIHAYLARKQDFLHFDWPTTLAETASVFGEMIVFNRLKDSLPTKQQKLALYASKIESVFATVFRQITMYRFEMQAHKRRAENGELSTQDLNALWRKGQKEMFGNSVTISPYEDTYWNTIPHIFHTPFYVYSYAFGDLLTRSLFTLYLSHPKQFVSRYMEMLASGGSKYPQELLAPFAINLQDPSFWQGGIEEIKQLTQEAKELAE